MIDIPQNSTLAIVAFVLSLLFFIPFLPLIGAILGIVALVLMKKDPKIGGKGFAIAAICIGFTITLIGVLILIGLFAFMGTFFSGFSVAAEEGVEAGMATCLEKESGIAKDTCMMMILAAYPKEAKDLDVSICTQAEMDDTESFCSAIILGNASLCEDLGSTSSKNDCIRLVQNGG